MSVFPYSNFKVLVPWIIASIWLPVTAAAAQTALGCARTPAEAANPYRLSTASGPLGVGMGYRVLAIRWDPLLQQRWAAVVRCGHPEFPAVAVQFTDHRDEITKSTSSLRNGKSANATSFPVVRVGDHVSLWSADHNLRIDTSGIAENSGSEGDIVRVRLTHFGLDDQSQHIVAGVIRGPREVEMQR
jgi:hypothetical protein